MIKIIKKTDTIGETSFQPIRTYTIEIPLTLELLQEVSTTRRPEDLNEIARLLGAELLTAINAFR